MGLIRLLVLAAPLLLVGGCAAFEPETVVLVWNDRGEEHLLRQSRSPKPTASPSATPESGMKRDGAPDWRNVPYIDTPSSLQRHVPINWQGVPLTVEELAQVLVAALRDDAANSNAPKTLASEALSGWPIAEMTQGQIFTEWRSIAGKEAGIWFWRKRYLAEVRHIITIHPALDGRSWPSYELRTEVQERPNEHYAWKPGDATLGRQSAEAVRATIQSAVLAALRRRLKS